MVLKPEISEEDVVMLLEACQSPGPPNAMLTPAGWIFFDAKDNAS